MSVFRKKSDVPEEQALLAAMDDIRKRPPSEPGTEQADDADADLADGAGDVSQGDQPGSDRAAGPLLDFGSLKVPAIDGMQLRVEMDEQENPIAVSVLIDETVLQLQAFAAPKTEPLWEEVRQEIAEGIRGGQGKAMEADGPYGRELHAEVVISDPSGSTTRQAARFIGVDGERWFLRGVVTGAGATEPAMAEAVLTIFGGVEVERGTQAAAPRDPLPITIPDDPALVAGDPAESTDGPDGQ
jgi:hypothetical protein